MNAFDVRKIIRPIVLILAVLIAVYTVVHLWNYYNAAPWTRDGRIRGDVIQVAPALFSPSGYLEPVLQ